jgi:hypothetical protein
MLVPRGSLGDAEEGEGSGGVAGVAAQRCGDEAVAAQAQDADGEVAEAGHGPGGVAGADLGGILGEGGVADVGQRLNAPMPSDPVGQAGVAGLGGGEAGDRVHGHGAPASAGQRADPAGNADRLGGVREVQASDGGDLEAADLHAVVAAVAGLVQHGDVWPRQRGELVAQAGLVGLDDQQVGGVLDAHQPVGMLTLGMEGVGGDHPPGKVQPVQQRPESGDLVGLAANVGLAQNPAGGCWSASHRPSAASTASASIRARTRRTVASSGGRQTPLHGSRRTPSAARTSRLAAGGRLLGARPPRSWSTRS